MMELDFYNVLHTRWTIVNLLSRVHPMGHHDLWKWQTGCRLLVFLWPKTCTVYNLYKIILFLNGEENLFQSRRHFNILIIKLFGQEVANESIYRYLVSSLMAEWHSMLLVVELIFEGVVLLRNGTLII